MAVNSSYYDHHFPINGRYPTAVDVISLYGSGSAALPKQATSTSPAESVVTPYASLDSYVNADGESTITFSDVTYYNGDVSTYKYVGNGLTFTENDLDFIENDLDDRVIAYCNRQFYARVQIKYRLSSNSKPLRYAIGHFGADCSTGMQPSRYFMTRENSKTTVNKDISTTLPTHVHNSIVFDPSTMGYSNGSKSDWNIDF